MTKLPSDSDINYSKKSNLMRIITDFDGPIMDLSDRYYRVYQLCLAKVRHPEQQLKILTQAEFWAYKRAHMSERQVGIESGLTIAQAELFKQIRDRTAHQLQYLPLDRVVPGAVGALDRIQAAGAELLVMTLRRTSELHSAFAQYSLDRFFPADCCYCVADDAPKQPDIPTKTQMMARALAELPPQPNTWMIGDTETDILAARAHEIPVVAVLSGIRDLDRLTAYQPDAIVPDLAAAVEWIFNLTSYSLKK
jgi:phosphoglycolate phosphatase-like HAD superfamily hydrolase